VVGLADDVDADWRLHLTIARDIGSERRKEIGRELLPLLPLACELHDLRLARLLANGRVTLTTL
jgi:hypothetical protein